MKKLIFLLLPFLIGFSTSPAQTNRGDYKKIDYIKVDDGQLEQFTALSKSEIKANYQSLVKTGALKSWSLYQVEYPGGEKNSYNFISVATAKNLSFFGDRFSAIGTLKILPDQAMDKTKSKIMKICSLIKSELWKVENHVFKSDSAASAPYLDMDYMDVTPRKNHDYLMLEDEVAKPIHEKRMNTDLMAGWEVYSLLTPGGLNYGYNYATANLYEKLEHLEFGFNDAVINQGTGGKVNIPELFDTIYETRDQVKTELWKRVVATR